MQSLDSIHDVLAVRIITRRKVDCYTASRVLASRWPALANREKNYIKQPKANGYQSLHSVHLADSGTPIEVQLRTPAMHWHAEFGVAAHWGYKERRRRRSSSASTEDAMAAMNAQIVAWSRMVLTYGHGVRDYRKSTGTEPLRHSSTLHGVTHALMATSAHSCIDNADLDRRRRDAAPATSATARARSSSGALDSDNALRAQSQSRERRVSFEDHLISSILPNGGPPALKSVLVAVSSAHGAMVTAVDAVVGQSTVDTLLQSEPSLAEVSPTRILVNGVPALGLTQPLTMGDCVKVLPYGERASVAAASRLYLATAPRPLAVLRRDLMRTLFRSERRAPAML